MAGPLKGGGGGVKGRAINEKRTFFGTFFFQSSNVSKAIKFEEGRVDQPPAIKSRLFSDKMYENIQHALDNFDHFSVM